MRKTIDIIGGGIAGLSTALILKQKGLNVNIYEAAPEIGTVGAGIILANNAMQVFKKINLQDKLARAGNRISYMKITNANLKPLSVVDLSLFEKKYGVSNLAIHRADLLKILADAVGVENILFGKRLDNIKKSQSYEFTFLDHSKYNSQAVIGADGIHSVVREQLFAKSEIRRPGQICWRGVVDFNLAENYQAELNEAWGKGKRFGFVKINATQVYWYALAHDREEYRSNASIKQIFKKFHPDILSIIDATPKEKIILHDLMDLKPIPHWQSGHVCLVGDAAHAMTPNLGQGACQAIEDAYILGLCFEKNEEIKVVFEQFELIRKKKVNHLVNTSWQIGKVAHTNNSMVIWVRNKMMQYAPSFINRKQMEMIFNV